MTSTIGLDDPTGLWDEIITLSAASSFLLVGGQMVRSFSVESDVPMPRTTDDSDALLRVTTTPEQPETFAQLLVGRGYEPVPMADELGYRFTQPDHGWSVDVLLPDKPRPRRDVRTIGTLTPAPIPGGAFALRHAESILVRTARRKGAVARPTLLGALLLKSRAARSDSGATAGRYREDLGFSTPRSAPRGPCSPRRGSGPSCARPIRIAALPPNHRQAASDAHRILTVE